MPSVYLEDHELVDFILERPEVLPMVIEKLTKERDDYSETNSFLYRTISDLKARIKELEGPKQ